jgi:hypothetical protein
VRYEVSERGVESEGGRRRETDEKMSKAAKQDGYEKNECGRRAKKM